MNTAPQTRILTTAINLQASRTFKRDLTGLGCTLEGQEFAKALAGGAAYGLTAEEIVEEVTKAMVGDQTLALELLEGVQTVAKAHVEQHTRTLPNGKTVSVHAYETARTEAMKQTTAAHGATFRAMRAKTPEAHENAASAHQEAAAKHGEAYDLHPRDVREAGEDHSNLKGQHQMAVDYHRSEAKKMREGDEYGKAQAKASYASGQADGAATPDAAEKFHSAAAEAHKKAGALGGEKEHGDAAEKHENHALAAKAAQMASRSPHLAGGRNEGAKIAAAQAGRAASNAAYAATYAAHTKNTPQAHQEAADAHANAADHHMTIHGEHEDSEDGHSGQIAQHHIALHAYHTSRAKPAPEKGEPPVAKAEAPRPPGENPHAAPGAILGIEAGCLAEGGAGNPGNSPVVKADSGPSQPGMAYCDKCDTAYPKGTEHHCKGGDGVAKADGPMTSMGGGTDLATKEGGEALAVEGRPDEKDRKDDDLDGKGMTGEIGKAEVAAHTRTVGGKVVQVSAYETHRDAALAHTLAAHKASAYPDKMAPEGHTAAAAAHQKAAELQREAAKYAPEEWTKKGHEDQAKVHEHYAHAHGQKAAAAGQKADSGVDAKVHSAESVAALENHEDHQGYGYLGHSSRTPETDAQVAEAANRAGLSPHHLAAHLLSKSGRHLMDDHKTGSTPEEATAHFQRWMTDPKNEKKYGINDYAKDLEKRAPRPEAAAKK